MGNHNRFLTANDLLHAIVIFGVLAITAAGVSGEFNVRGDIALATAGESSSSGGNQS